MFFLLCTRFLGTSFSSFQNPFSTFAAVVRDNNAYNVKFLGLPELKFYLLLKQSKN